MPKVLFTEDRLVQDEHRDNPEKRTFYRANQVYDLDQASIDRWVKRGVVVTDEAKIKAAEEAGKSETGVEVGQEGGPSKDSVPGGQAPPSQPAPDSSSGAERNARDPSRLQANQQANQETVVNQGTVANQETTANQGSVASEGSVASQGSVANQGTLSSAMTSNEMPGLPGNLPGSANRGRR